MQPYRVWQVSIEALSEHEAYIHTRTRVHQNPTHLLVPGLDVEPLAEALHEHGLGSLRTFRAPAVVVLRGGSEERYLWQQLVTNVYKARQEKNRRGGEDASSRFLDVASNNKYLMAHQLEAPSPWETQPKN